MSSTLDYERAHELFVCDPANAIIYWRATKKPAGKRVKWSKSTRVIIRFEGVNYLQDDIIWLLKYHAWPDYYNDDTTTASTEAPKLGSHIPRGVTVEVKYCPKSALYRIYTKKNGVMVSTSAYPEEEDALRVSALRRRRLKNVKTPKTSAFLYRKVELAFDDKLGWKVLIRKGGKIVGRKTVSALLYPTEANRKRFAIELQQRYRMEDEDAFFVMYKMERYES
jgi:hypothetical protein